MKYFNTEVKNNVAIVTFDRPPVNAYNDESYEEMIYTFGALNQMKNVCSAVFYTPGKWWSPGNDLKEANKNPTWETEKKSLSLLLEASAALRNVEVPVVAAVRGYCLGGGFGFARACDMIICSETAKFGMPELRAGICSAWAGLDSFTTPAFAKYMYYTGKSISAEEMYRFGNIIKVVPDDQLLDEAIELAETFRYVSPSAVKMAKRAMAITHNRGLEDDRALQAMCSEAFFRDHFDERLEALRAFSEKRKPRFFEE